MIHLDKLSLSVTEASLKQPARFALDHVRIDDRRTVATNGHWIAAVEHAEPDSHRKLDGPVLLSRETVDGIRKGMPKGDGIAATIDVEETNANGHVALNVPMAECRRVDLRIPRGSSTFPDVDQFLDGNGFGPEIRVCISTTYLAKIAKLAKMANGADGAGVTFTIHQRPDGAVAAPISFKAGRLSGAVMPIILE